MSGKSLLQNAYSGRLDLYQLRIFKDIVSDDKSRQSIQRFLEVQKEYPPAYLDEKAVIPPEAMDRIRKIGVWWCGT